LVEVEVDDSEVIGGSATSLAEIGGGGGRVELAPVPVVVNEECIEMNAGRVDLGLCVGVGESGSEEESSFSHTISGVQIRSGSERTTIGGALSASRCLLCQLCPMAGTFELTWQL
jgi:hypothetical protein